MSVIGFESHVRKVNFKDYLEAVKDYLANQSWYNNSNVRTSNSLENYFFSFLELFPQKASMI